MTATAEPRAALHGLWATTPQPLPFAPALHIRAFLLERAHGNLLVYGAGLTDADRAAIAARGGVARWYLNHHHEAAFAAGPVSAPLIVHEREREAVERTLHVRATFSRRHRLDDDVELIPTPGHTPGATALLWDSGEHRLLFTGDTVILRGGEWIAAVLGSSDRTAYLESLALLREIDFDVLVPWAATADDLPYAHTDRDDARRRLDAIIARIRDGADR